MQVPVWICRLDSPRTAGWQVRLGPYRYFGDHGKSPRLSLAAAKQELANRLKDPEIAALPRVQQELTGAKKGLRRRLDWEERGSKRLPTGHTGVLVEIKKRARNAHVTVRARLYTRDAQRVHGIPLGPVDTITLRAVKEGILIMAAMRQWTIERATAGLATPREMIDFASPHPRVVEIRRGLKLPPLKKSQLDAEIERIGSP